MSGLEERDGFYAFPSCAVRCLRKCHKFSGLYVLGTDADITRVIIYHVTYTNDDSQHS